MLIEPLIETSRGDPSGGGASLYYILSSPSPLVVSLRIPLLMILDIVHRPDGALHVLHPLEALVEAQVVADSVLKEKHIILWRNISYTIQKHTHMW